MLTKTSIAKTVFLSLITLGIYGLVWFAKRRNEIVEKYKIQLPHWRWIVLPSTIALPLTVAISFVTVSFLPLIPAIMVALSFGAVALLIVYAICFWWLMQFAVAVEKVTSGRMPAAWTMLYWTFTGIGVVFVLQHFFNTLPAKKKPALQQPTRRFIGLSIITIVAMIMVSVAVGIAVSFVTIKTPSQSELTEIDQLSKKANLLGKKYDYCTNTLNDKYPSVSPEQEAEYLKGHDACEALRLEQNKAANDAAELWEDTTGWTLIGQ